MSHFSFWFTIFASFVGHILNMVFFTHIVYILHFFLCVRTVFTELFTNCINHEMNATQWIDAICMSSKEVARPVLTAITINRNEIIFIVEARIRLNFWAFCSIFKLNVDRFNTLIGKLRAKVLNVSNYANGESSELNSEATTKKDDIKTIQRREKEVCELFAINKCAKYHQRTHREIELMSVKAFNLIRFRSLFFFLVAKWARVNCNFQRQIYSVRAHFNRLCSYISFAQFTSRLLSFE